MFLDELMCKMTWNVYSLKIELMRINNLRRESLTVTVFRLKLISQILHISTRGFSPLVSLILRLLQNRYFMSGIILKSINSLIGEIYITNCTPHELFPQRLELKKLRHCTFLIAEL